MPSTVAAIDPREAARRVKARALELGFEAAGIAAVAPHHRLRRRQLRDRGTGFTLDDARARLTRPPVQWLPRHSQSGLDGRRGLALIT